MSVQNYHLQLFSSHLVGPMEDEQPTVDIVESDTEEERRKQEIVNEKDKMESNREPVELNSDSTTSDLNTPKEGGVS